jgi:hypothetical protein
MKMQPFEWRNNWMIFPSELDMLTIFRDEADKPKTIQPGMSPEELSDIISDRLIELVKRDLKMEGKEASVEEPGTKS